MAKTLKKSIKRQPVKTEVKKPSSIYFADYSNKVPTHITPVARPMVLAPTYNANAVLRAAGANVIDYKPTAEQVNKIFKKIDYSNITDRNEIIDTAIDQVLGAETDPNKKKQLQTLLRMTNYMENKYGEADDAWKNKSVNYGFTELDKISIDNLFKPKGDKGNYTKGQKNAFEYLKNFGLPTDQKELEKLLLNNDPLANMAVSRLVYATNPKALPDMNDQKAVFNYWLNDYNHRGAIKHQTEEDLFKIFQEGYNKYNSSDYKPVIHVNSDGTAVIDDNRGQWEYPGEVTRIASNDITMKGVPYPVLGVGADGEQRMMYPNEEHTFNQGPVTEYPMMQAQNGGWLSKYQNHENLRADGTKKGTGYFGVLNRPDGGVSTEISIGVNINGKEVEIPTMVPTLTKEELDYLLTNPVDKEDLLDTPIGQSIGNKAVEYSKQRMNKGLNPFYQEGEERSGLPRHLQNPGIASVYEENNKPDWTNVAPEYNRGGVTWLNEYQSGGTAVTYNSMPAGTINQPAAQDNTQVVSPTGPPVYVDPDMYELPVVQINREAVPQWKKDRANKNVDKINFWESWNPKKWGDNDYSDYSSFNSAFRNSKESGEKEFVYKGKRYNTELVDKKYSDEYNKQKQWLSDYIKSNTPTPLLDSREKEQYYKNYVSQVSPEGQTQNGELVEANNFTNYTRDQKIKQQLEKLNNPYYFSITEQKPQEMTADGYMDSKNKKIFFNTNPAAMPEDFNTAYLHELSHKSENSDDVLHTVPIVDVNLMKQKANGNYVNKWDQKTLDYVSEPTEVQARKMSTLYYLDQNKLLNKDDSGRINITKEQLDKLYGLRNSNEKKIPYDINQLLDLYTYQRDDLLNYLNNDFTKYKNRWNTPDKKKNGGKIRRYQIGGGVNLASPEYAEYEFLKSLQSSSPGINTQQPVSEQPETELPMVSEKRTKGYNETLLNKLKGLIDPAGANEPEGNSMEDIIQLGTRGRQKGLTRASIFDKPEDIDFSELDRQQRTQQTQERRTQTTQTSNYYSEEPMPQGVPAISNPIGKRAYAALVKELRKDSSTADDAINIAKLLLAQSALETGQWTSPAALKAGNLSGIKFYGQKGRKPSTVLAPGGEEKGYRRPYVQYDSPEDWASGMIQLMKGRYKDALYSTSPEEYAARLKARGYYSGDQSAYAKQMRNFFKQFKFQ